jgi:hypothetical protein
MALPEKWQLSWLKVLRQEAVAAVAGGLVTVAGIVLTATGTSIKLSPWALIVLGLVILLLGSAQAWRKMRYERDTVSRDLFVAIGEGFQAQDPSGPPDPRDHGVETWNRLFDVWIDLTAEWIRSTRGEDAEDAFRKEVKPPVDSLIGTHHQRLSKCLQRGLTLLRKLK